MKLAFSTLGCPAWSWNHILDFAKQEAFDGIEVRGIQESLSAGEIHRTLASHQRSTKVFLQENPIKLVCLGTSIHLHDWTGTGKEEIRDEFTQSKQTCHEYQIPALRVFGNTFGQEEPQVVIERVIEALHELCALDSSLSVLLEVHGDFSTIESLSPIVSEVQETNFGIVWDVAHSDLHYGDEYARFYDVIAAKIKHVHIKDHHRTGGLCLVGEGDIPLLSIIRRLEKDGYDGYYSFEWEKRWIPELEDPLIALKAYLQYMRQIEL